MHCNSTNVISVLTTATDKVKLTKTVKKNAQLFESNQLKAVSDYRAVNNGLLDTYQLKSLDGVVEAGMEDVTFVRKTTKSTLSSRKTKQIWVAVSTW